MSRCRPQQIDHQWHEVSSYRPDESREEIDIVVRFPETYRNLAQLDQFRIQSPAAVLASTIEWSHALRLALSSGWTQRAIKVMADVEDGLPADKVTELRHGWRPSIRAALP